MALWACLQFPELGLDLCRRQGLDDAQALVLVEGPPQRRVIATCNRAAHNHGIHAGMSLAAAQARAAGLQVRERDRDAERAALHRLATWAYGYSDQVAVLDEASALCLELGRSLRLFGGVRELAGRLRGTLAMLAHTHQLCIAPNPAAARLLSRAGDGLHVLHAHLLERRLRPLPIRLSELPGAQIATLESVGVRTLGDWFALPRDGLARRFGQDMLVARDRLLGLLDDPQAAFHPPSGFHSRLELPAAVSGSEGLLFALRRLLQELACGLAGRDGGVQRFDLTFVHEDIVDSRIEIGCVQPERDPQRLIELVRDRIEHLRLPAPTVELRLDATQLPEYAPQSLDLFDTRPQREASFARLLDRLHARLGADAVQQLQVLPDHRPERAWQRQAVQMQARTGNASRSSRRPGLGPMRNASTAAPATSSAEGSDRVAGTPALAMPDALRPGERPLWLLPEPQPIDGESMELLAGPERIETGWWDGADITRDYWLARTREGAHCWIWRDRRPPHSWWLQGWL